MNPGRLITTLKWILRIGGLWKPDGDGRFSRLYKVYSWCFIFTFSVMYTAFMCANLYFLRDISELAEMLFVSMTELALVVKIINFYVNNSRLKYMLRCMRGFRLETQAEQEIMQSRLAFLIKSTIIYYFCANTSIQATAVNSAFNETDKLMYSGYYPGVDWQHNRADYWFVLGYQYIGILFTCQINLAIDSYFCTMMYLLSGQAIILGNRLSNAGAAGNSKRQSSIEQRSALVKNIETHNDIVQFIQNLQHCLWWSFLGQMVLSAITVGSIVNEMLSASTIENMFDYLSKVAGSLAFTIQIFIMCFHGQCIISECEILPDRLYESNWIDMIDARRGGDYGKIACVFMGRLKRNGQILIGKTYPLSLNTFKAIMSFAYRLLALIR